MNDATKQNGDEKFALSSSRHFPEWLAGTGGSIAFTTYQAGKLFLIGLRPDGRLSVFARDFTHCMGLAVSADGQSLALATKTHIQRFDNVLPLGQTTPDSGSGSGTGGYDALYSPHAAWVTGDVDAHDVAFGSDGRPLFVNTLFACVATVSDGHSFRPVWKPPFISRLAAEDRCHLNGFAVADGRPVYATAVSRTDAADGWRDQRREGGVVLDVERNEVVVAGLSMPHSPRLHGGRLWLLNSGRGQFGYVDGDRFVPVAFCPGYARGLAFVGNYAVIGLSLARENRNFSGLELDDALASRAVEPRCGLAVVDLTSGDMVHWVRIEGRIRELYDVAALPGVRRPSAIGFKTDEVNRVITIEE